MRFHNKYDTSVWVWISRL